MHPCLNIIFEDFAPYVRLFHPPCLLDHGQGLDSNSTPVILDDPTTIIMTHKYNMNRKDSFLSCAGLFY